MYAPQIVKNQDLKHARQQRTRQSWLPLCSISLLIFPVIVTMLDPVPDGIMQKPLRDTKKSLPRSRHPWFLLRIRSEAASSRDAASRVSA